MPIPASNSARSVMAMDVDIKPSVCSKCGDRDKTCHHGSFSQEQNKDNLVECQIKNPPADPRTEHTRWRNPMLTYRKDDDPWVDISDRRLPSSRLGALYAGSRFTGVQKCNPTSYEVAVDILHIDLNESVMSGYLNIKGLTPDFLDLTTFFEAEIIGPKYSFLTRKWQAQQHIDLDHWKRFPSFKPYIKLFNQDDFVYDPLNSDYIYMRWKEHFLVPDHRVHTIDGASYAGFYYICYQRSTNEISGLYFYKNNQEWYQALSLTHVEERCFSHFELR